MDLNEGAGSGIWMLYHEPKTLTNDQSYNLFVTRPTLDGYWGCDKEHLRQTILKHESLFRYQVSVVSFQYSTDYSYPYYSIVLSIQIAFRFLQLFYNSIGYLISRESRECRFISV